MATRLNCPHCRIFLTNSGVVSELDTTETKPGKCRYCNEPIEVVIKNGTLLNIRKQHSQNLRSIVKQDKSDMRRRKVQQLKNTGFSPREIYKLMKGYEG